MTSPVSASERATTDELSRAPRAVLQRLDRLLEGRWWLAIVVALAFTLSVIAATPSYAKFNPDGEDWTAIQRMGERPFDQEGLDPTDRSYNFTFRVTVPFIGAALGLEPAGYLVLQALGGLALFASSALLVERITSSRRLAALASISTGLMWAGACAFVEVRGNFDAVAIALLIAAMATRKPPLVAAFSFLAAWTDERAIPAVAFVVLFHHLIESTDLRWWKGLREPRALAAIIGVALHVFTRLAVTAAFDIQQPSNLGTKYIKEYISILPMGMWTGLEGFWVFVVGGGVVLWHMRERLLSGSFLGLVAVFSIGAISITDVTRSMAYLLPAGFAGLAVLTRFTHERLVKRAVYLQFTLTAAAPLYYAGGAFSIYWFYPLPLMLLRRLAGID